MTRIGVIADTHIPKVAPCLPVDLLRGLQGCDLILHAGDLVSMQVLEELRAIAPVEAVHGNMDPSEVTSALPGTRVVEVEGKRIGLVHGGGPPLGIERRVLSRFTGVDAVVFGHTHRPVVGRRKGILLVNPGTPTDLRFSKRLSYAVITVDGDVLDAEIIDLG